MTGFSCFRDPICLKHLLPVADHISGSHEPRSCTAALPQRQLLWTEDSTFAWSQLPWHMLRWEAQQLPEQWTCEASHCGNVSGFHTCSSLSPTDLSVLRFTWCYHKSPWLSTSRPQSVGSPQGSTCSSSRLENKAREQPESLGLLYHKFPSDRMQTPCPNPSPQAQNQLLQPYR